MAHLTNTPQAEYRAWFYPHEHVSDEAAAPSVKEAARQRLERMFDVISDQLGDRQWLLGDRFSAADLFLLMLIRWGRGMPRPPRDIPSLKAFADRVLARPAVEEAFRVEGIQAPYI
jgi:glutathione S-transferase